LEVGIKIFCADADWLLVIGCLQKYCINCVRNYLLYLLAERESKEDITIVKNFSLLRRGTKIIVDGK